MQDLIYARQSVDKEDSISIESQIELCLREVGNNKYKVFQDKGYSGKNTDRPAFQEMMNCIRNGETNRVIVYKLDRISRSVLDFAGLINEFQKYNVEFVSITERFDTSTPIGKAMLMIVMIFAQLERETIQQRVIDAYKSRSRKGFYMGGRIPYGMKLKEVTIDGIKTRMYEWIPEQIEVVRLIFKLYSNPQTSMTDVMRYLDSRNIRNSKGNNFSLTTLHDLVINTAYVRCDERIYQFFTDQGVNIANDISQFTGTNGAYLYSGENKGRRTMTTLPGSTLVLAPHEGCVDSETWLRCRVKCMNLKQVAKPIKAKRTWLAGKIKCAHCGHALVVREAKRKTKEPWRSFICEWRYIDLSCPGVGSIPVQEVEDVVYVMMLKKLKEYKTLSSRKEQKTPPELIKLQVRQTQLENEIKTFVDKVKSANATTMTYINQRIDELDGELSDVKKQIAEMSASLYSKINTESITNYMDNWDELTMSDKITVVDALISAVIVDKGNIRIEWKTKSVSP